MPPPPVQRQSSPPPPPRPSSPPPRPSSPPPRPQAPPRPSGPNLDDADLDLGSLDTDVEETGSWIPDEEADLSQLMDLDVDDSSLLAVGDLPSDNDSDPQSDGTFFEDDEEAPSFFLFRYMFTDEKLDNLDDKGWPGWLVKVVGKLRWIYALGAAVALLGLMVTIVVVAVSGGDEIQIPQPPALAQAQGQPQQLQPSVKDGAGSTPQQGQHPAVNEGSPGVPQPAVETPALGPPDIAVPTAGKTCRPWAQYPEFPWKDKLEKAASGVGAAGICGLFGQTSSKVAGLFAGTPMVGPGGHDSVKGGGLLELFFAEKATRPGPSMEMLFVGDKLYEVRLNYRETEAADLEAKGIGEVLEGEPESLKDSLGRKITRFVDGDVVVDFVEESWYGRTLKTLVLSSSQVRQALLPSFDNYDKAMSSMASGDGEFGKWKFEGALEKYVEAAETMDTLGLAHVKQALMLTRLEEFEKVEKAARRALQVSTENRVRAEAQGLLAVTALYNGDSGAALAHFKEAAAADIANSFFSMSASELESGEYATARVARTAARMECLKKKTYKSTFRGLLARGNFPDNQTYFDVLKKAMADPKFAKLKKDASRGECR